MRISIIFYSMYGHIYRMAEAVAEGAREVEGADVTLYQVPELVPENILKDSGAFEARKAFEHIPVIGIEQLDDADAVIFGAPTRFGMMASQMRNFLDQAGSHWLNGTLVGKPAGVFTSTATQHGGQETTIVSFHATLLHLGFIVVGVPYTEQRLMNLDEITGGSPYGASTLAGGDGSRWPTGNELGIARFQGRHVAGITRKLLAGEAAL